MCCDAADAYDAGFVGRNEARRGWWMTLGVCVVRGFVGEWESGVAVVAWERRSRSRGGEYAEEVITVCLSGEKESALGAWSVMGGRVEVVEMGERVVTDGGLEGAASRCGSEKDGRWFGTGTSGRRADAGGSGSGESGDRAR